MVYQRQGRWSTQNYLQREKNKEWYTNAKANDQLKIIYSGKKHKEWYTNAKANDQLKIIYNGKKIKNGIPTPRPTINSKLFTTKKT